MKIEIILILIWMHFIADFLLQSDMMAINKSKSIKWLSVHIFWYSLIFFNFGFKFAIFNAGAHFLIDFVTSRITSKLWQKEQRHWFFITIGFDQALHITTLILSYKLLCV